MFEYFKNEFKSAMKELDKVFIYFILYYMVVIPIAIVNSVVWLLNMLQK